MAQRCQSGRFLVVDKVERLNSGRQASIRFLRDKAEQNNWRPCFAPRHRRGGWRPTIALGAEWALRILLYVARVFQPKLPGAIRRFERTAGPGRFA